MKIYKLLLKMLSLSTTVKATKHKIGWRYSIGGKELDSKACGCNGGVGGAETLIKITVTDP